MLYYTWHIESSDLLGDYSSYSKHYKHVKPVVNLNEQKYTVEHVDDVEIDEDSPPTTFGVRMPLPLKKIYLMHSSKM